MIQRNGRKEVYMWGRRNAFLLFVCLHGDLILEQPNDLGFFFFSFHKYFNSLLLITSIDHGSSTHPTP